MKKGITSSKRIKIQGPLIILIVLVVFFGILEPNFFSLSNATNIIRQASVLALAAFGQTFVILVGGIDLSIGAVMGLTSCSAGLLMLNQGFSPLMAVLVAVGIATLCGLINGVVTNYIGLNPFVSTFGMWGMALGIGLIITNERVVYGFNPALRVLHDGSLLGIPVPLILVMIIWAILFVFLKSTSPGIATYAIGGNADASRLSGIRVTFHKTMLYTFSGFMAGLAGIMFLARSNSAQAIETIGFEFDSICAVVLGGTSLAGGKGGVKQTLLGVILFATMRNGMNMIGINLYLQLVFIGVIIIMSYIAENLKHIGFRPALLKKAAVE